MECVDFNLIQYSVIRGQMTSATIAPLSSLVSQVQRLRLRNQIILPLHMCSSKFINYRFVFGVGLRGVY